MEDLKIYIPLYGRFQNIHIRYTKSLQCSLWEISLVYNLHIENKNVVFV
jgi:hypothetical protein